MFDYQALQQAPVVKEPFPYLILPRFVGGAALAAIERDFPDLQQPGSFPLESLRYGPGFEAFTEELRQPRLRQLLGEKLGIDLSGRPAMITVRGQCRERDGQIHTDSITKLVTVLIYLNGQWEGRGGRLRLLRRPDNLNDVVAEVPPEQGTLLAFINAPNAWHGHESYSGQRRSLQLNWVRDAGVVWREQLRHKVSAFFKRLRAA